MLLSTMPYKKPTQWYWIALIPSVIYSRFFWEPPVRDGEISIQAVNRFQKTH